MVLTGEISVDDDKMDHVDMLNRRIALSPEGKFPRLRSIRTPLRTGFSRETR